MNPENAHEFYPGRSLSKLYLCARDLFWDSCSLLCVPSSSLTAKQLSEAVELELFDSETALELLFAKVFWLRKKSFSLIICEIELQPKITAACIITSKIYRETFKDHIWNLYCMLYAELDEPFRLNRSLRGRIWTVDGEPYFGGRASSVEAQPRALRPRPIHSFLDNGIVCFPSTWGGFWWISSSFSIFRRNPFELRIR